MPVLVYMLEPRATLVQNYRMRPKTLAPRLSTRPQKGLASGRSEACLPGIPDILDRMEPEHSSAGEMWESEFLTPRDSGSNEGSQDTQN